MAAARALSVAVLAAALGAWRGGWLTSLALRPLVACLALSAAGCALTLQAVPHMRPSFVRARLTGIDLNKRETRRDAHGVLVRPIEGPIVPEAMGVVACAAYLTCLFLFIPVPFAQPGAPAYSDPSFPHAELAKLLCALLSICCMCFLGFADNVLDLRWRDRLVLPLAASLPVLMTYAATGGVTTVRVPSLLHGQWPLVGSLGPYLDIGALYFAYISMLAIFCTNAINILAGVNGLECGQSVVIGLTVAIFNLVQLARWPADREACANNLFSLYIVLPFIGCSLGARARERAPRRVRSRADAIPRTRAHSRAERARRRLRPCARARTRAPSLHRAPPCSPRPAVSQLVPVGGLRGGHVLLLCGDDVRRRGHPWPLLQDDAALLLAAGDAAAALRMRGASASAARRSRARLPSGPWPRACVGWACATRHPKPCARPCARCARIQLANFVYSLPQLALLIPCPRHRMPGYDRGTDRLTASECEFAPAELRPLGRLIYRVLAGTKLARVTVDADGRVRMSNLTIINLVLVACGPMHERSLTLTLLALQACCSAVAFAIRYPLAAMLYDVVR